MIYTLKVTRPDNTPERVEMEAPSLAVAMMIVSSEWPGTEVEEQR